VFRYLVFLRLVISTKILTIVFSTTNTQRGSLKSSTHGALAAASIHLRCWENVEPQQEGCSLGEKIIKEYMYDSLVSLDEATHLLPPRCSIA
jgi:hypothetical protein